MARIELSPNVDNYFEKMDWRESQDNLPAFRKTLIAHYESGKVIVLENTPFRIDYDLLNQVTIPEGRRFKKLTDRFFLQPKLYRPADAQAFLATFGVNPAFYFKVRREVQSVNAQVREFGKTLFSSYEFLEWDVSWRFTQTGPEDLHLDSFGNNEDFQYVRIFINIDQKPRIWNVSHRLDELAKRYYGSGHLEKLRDRSGNEFCHALNLLAFGGMERAGQDGHDRHVVELEQGDVWLCDSRVVSHQIVSGQRLVASHFKVDTSSMMDPNAGINAKVRHLHELYGPQEAARAS